MLPPVTLPPVAAVGQTHLPSHLGFHQPPPDKRTYLLPSSPPDKRTCLRT
ncbi:hypothetical protein HanIR_Chr13g0644961 [Helianthus annuus]|nr:hypothetical protein HanIR_Chr13g0644961 [Helianthus annuus]